jgi:hypothetical protein
MLKQKEIDEIGQLLWFLPLDKLTDVREYVIALKKRYGYDNPIDDSDEWTEEDMRDATEASLRRLEEEDPWEEPGDV